MVTTTVSARIAAITFGGTKGNSLPGELLRELASRIAEAGRRDDVAVVVLRSEGEGPFCAGASFDELKSIGDEAAGKRFFLGFANVILAMTRCPRPIIVRVQGKTVGGGVGIVAAADYAIARKTASIRLSELAIGIGPFVVGPVIEHRIGRGPYAAMSFDADWRDAEWAARHGLYASVKDSPAELDESIDKFAATLASANPEAITRIKRIVWAGTESWHKLLDERAAMSGALVLSEFTKKAIAAFEKR
jgi:methylglutaconyl-CoA hydratase